MFENGIVKIINDQVYICDLNIADFAREFEGQWVEFGMCNPSPSRWLPIDPAILPLVEALQKIGIMTLSSCEGHFLVENRVKYPFVSMLGQPAIPVAEGWQVVKIGTGVWRLRTIEEAHSVEEAEALKQLIPAQVEVLLD